MRKNRLLNFCILFISGLAFIFLCALSIAPSYNQLKIILFLSLCLAVGLWSLPVQLRWERSDWLYGVCALILSLLVSMYFNQEYIPVWLIESSALGRAAARLRAEPFALLTLLRWLGVCAAVPFLTLCFKGLRKAIRQFYRDYRFLLKPFALLTLLYLLGISAILRANYNYIDDMGRAAEGYHQWDAFSRYLSTFLSNLVHMDWYLTDVSPFPQILAAVLLAAAGVLMIHAISEKEEISIWNLTAALPLGLSPYFLECFSYKFDSPYMALSVFFSIVPILWSKRGGWSLLLAAALGTLGMCCTYQAAAGIFPMLVLLLWLRRWSRRVGAAKDRLRFVLLSAAGYVSGLVLFKLFFMHPVDPELYTVAELPPLGEFIPNALANYKLYFSLVITDFRMEWLAMIALTLFSFLALSVMNTKGNKITGTLLSLAATLLMLLLSFGIYPLLREPLFAPRAMYGFGMFLCCIGIPLTTEERPAAKAVPVFLSFAFFVFAFSYGNALSMQNSYTDFRIRAVVQDLQELELGSEGTEPYIRLAGSIGYAPGIRNMPENYGILRRLVPVVFNGEWYWGRYGFYEYYDLRGVSWNANDNDPADLTLPVLKDTMYHTIRGDGEQIVIQLK